MPRARPTHGKPAATRNLCIGLPAHSDPAWQAMKSSRRNLQPHEAVRECDFLRASYYGWARMADGSIDFQKIVAVLQAKKVPFVLTGAHGISTWTGRPRATFDVDILVKAGRNQARAVNALRAAFPGLEVRRFTGVVAFFVPGQTESVIDVTYPHRPDNEVTLQTALWVEAEGLRYRIPTLEAALANKYGAMLSIGREMGKRGQDAVDFYLMVKHSTDPGRTPLDLEALAELGELVWPGGGGAEILRFVEEVKAGRMPTPNRAS